MSAAARCCSAWSSAAMCCWRISRPGSWTGSASAGGIAHDQPAPRLRLGLGLRPHGARPRQSGDGSDDPGGLGTDRGDRLSGRAAGQGRPGGRRFHFRHPSLCRHPDRAVRARAHRPRPPRRGGDAGGRLRDPDLATARLFRDRRGAAAHRQRQPRPRAVERLPDQ